MIPETDQETTEGGLSIRDLFCPECGVKARHDHNAMWCNFCGKLWPKGHGYEDKGRQAAEKRKEGKMDELPRRFDEGARCEILRPQEELIETLRLVMASVGMFETHPIPGHGRCLKCYCETIAPGVNVCRKCAREMGLKILGQNTESTRAENKS